MRVAGGADGAFIDLVRDEHRGLIAASVMIVGSQAAAEEIVQDAFERAYVRWDKVSKLDRPGAWVRRAVINQSISASRRSKNERRALGRLAGRRDAHLDEIAEPMQELWAAVSDLPVNQVTALALRYGADLALVEVAEALQTTESAVKSLLHRARSSLREHEMIKEMVQ